jgi:hypothetical protein
MLIIGLDYHPSVQQIALLDLERGDKDDVDPKLVSELGTFRRSPPTMRAAVSPSHTAAYFREYYNPGDHSNSIELSGTMSLFFQCASAHTSCPASSRARIRLFPKSRVLPCNERAHDSSF